MKGFAIALRDRRIRKFEKHVGVAGLIEPAPAGQILAAQLIDVERKISDAIHH